MDTDGHSKSKILRENSGVLINKPGHAGPQYGLVGYKEVSSKKRVLDPTEE